MLFTGRTVWDEAVRGKRVLGIGEGSRESKGEGTGEAWRAIGFRIAGASSSRPEMSRGARGRRVDDCAVVELVRELIV